MGINVDLRDLRAFALLAELGQFNRTAEALALTPAALSRRIAKLENALGGPLLHRTTRRMVLTPAGMRFHAKLNAILASLDDCLDDASRQTRGLEGRIVVACFASMSHTLFPHALARTHALFPNVQVCLRDGSGTQVMESVIKREAEFGLTTVTDVGPELHAETIATDRYELACPIGHALSRRRSITWEELADHRVLSFSASGASRRQIDPILRLHGIRLPWFDEVDQLSTMIGHLEQGQFIAVLPSLMAAASRDTVRIPLKNPVIERQVVLFRRTDTFLSPAASTLWTELKAGIGIALSAVD